jgi:hypothetical protein
MRSLWLVGFTAHGFSHDQPDHSTARKAGSATGIKPARLLCGEQN